MSDAAAAELPPELYVDDDDDPITARIPRLALAGPNDGIALPEAILDELRKLDGDVRTPAEAIAWEREHRTWAPNLCLQYQRTAFGVPARDPDAAAAWRLAERKHRVERGAQCPRGALVFWTGGRSGHGHVALATGNGNCWSTDAAGEGNVAKVSIDELTRRWGLILQGWAEDVNGVAVWPDDGAGVGRGLVDYPGRDAFQIGEKHDAVKLLRKWLGELPAGDELADHFKSPRRFTQGVSDAVARFQRHHGLEPASGIPDRVTWQLIQRQAAAAPDSP